jgi:hypothetical protein
MTIAEVVALTGLPNKDGLWQKLIELRKAQVADPFQDIANLDATHAVTAADIRAILTADVIADSTQILSGRTTAGRLGWVLIGLLVSLLPVLMFLLLRFDAPVTNVIAAARNVPPYHQIVPADIQELPTRVPNADSLRNKTDVVGAFSSTGLKAGDLLTKGTLSAADPRLSWNGAEMVSLKVQRLPKNFVTSFPRAATLWPISAATRDKIFPVNVVLLEVSDGDPTLVRVAVTDSQWDALRAVIGKSEISISVSVP